MNRTILCLVYAVMSSSVMTAFGQSIHVDRMLGLPPGSQQPAEVTRDKVVHDLTTSFQEQIDRIAREDVDIGYWHRKPITAVAACLDPAEDNMADEPFLAIWETNKWAWADGEKTQSDAVDRALKTCVGYNGSDIGDVTRCKCVPLFSGEHNQELILPEPYIESYVKAETTLAQGKAEAYRQAKKILTLDRALASSKNPAALGGRNLVLRLTRPVDLGYPDEDRDVRQACQKRIVYGWIHVKREAERVRMAELRRLTSAGLYGCYHISVDVSEHPLSLRTHQLNEQECRFVNSVDPAHEDDSGILESEKWLRQTFGAEKLLSIWGEGVARVDQDGNPIDVRTVTLPLAVQTDNGLYIGVELLLPDPHFECALTAPFENEVFNLSRCGKKTEECSRSVERELFLAFNVELSRPPFGASRIAKREPPGEMIMERQFKPSLVLGSPYFERSTYLIQMWNTDEVQDEGGSFENAAFKGAQGKRLVFLRVSHIFTQSANAKGIYTEPDPAEIRSYSEKLVDAVSKSIESACLAVGGIMESRICEVTPK